MRWIIGDIHGMAGPLEALLGAIFGRDPSAHCIFVGDYVNRGPDSRRVIELLLSVDGTTLLRGNHDDMFDLILNGSCYTCHPSAPDAVSAFRWFMRFGLDATLASYGVDPADLKRAAELGAPEALARVTAAVPETHRRFIRDLRPVFEADDFYVAHGMWNPEERDDSPPMLSQLEQSDALRHRLLWGRFSDTQIKRKKRWKRTGYFGHTPVQNYASAGGKAVPIRGPRVVLLDTAIALLPTGMLSAVCAETGTVIQADRSGLVVEREEDPAK